MTKLLKFSKEEMLFELMNIELQKLSVDRRNRVLNKLKKEYSSPMQVSLALLWYVIKETK